MADASQARFVATLATVVLVAGALGGGLAFAVQALVNTPAPFAALQPGPAVPGNGDATDSAMTRGEEANLEAGAVASVEGATQAHAGHAHTAQSGEVPGEVPGGTPPAPTHDPNHPALLYVRALQQGDWNAVVAQTRWMIDRLQYVRRNKEAGGAEAEARQALVHLLSDFDPAERRITPEGVPDAYVFTPQAQVAWAGRDAGRDDLAYAVAERVWLRVVYPEASRALRGPDNRPLRSLRVGLNLDEDGNVLKAGVLGNVEIDRDSFVYAAPRGS